MAPQFTYTTLPAGQLRVIRLPARTSGCSEPLTATLEHVPWESDFACVSYCWGSPEAPRVIKLNGCNFQVTQNLHYVLTTLSPCKDKSSPITYSPPLWIDAISINQSDNEEKSRLVQLMGAIYAGRRVFACLGPNDEECELAMKVLKIIITELEDKLMAPLDVVAYLRSKWFNADDSPTEELRSIQAFCARPYWSRAWIVQEVLLAREVSFICGGTYINRDELRSKMTFILFYFPACRPSIACKPSSVEKLSFNAGNALGLVRGDKFDLKRMLISFHVSMGPFTEDRQKINTMRATNPRDYIFGLAGILNKEMTALGITVDYTLSPQALFVHFARAYLEGYGDIEFLGFCQFPKVTGGLPSWVPDWDMNMQAPLWLMGDDGQFKASGQTNSSLVVSQDPWTLHISGYRIGQVLQVGQNITDTSEFDTITVFRELTQMMDGWEDSVSPYQSEEALKESLWRTAIVDCQSQTFDISAETTRHDFGGRMRADHTSRKCFETIADFARRKTLDENLLPTAGEEEDMIAYTNNVGIALIWRKTFVCNTGHIGVGPSNAQSGDTVVIFAGSSTPSILRKQSDNNFSLIGEAYVHGIMYGEHIISTDLDLECFSLI